MRPSPRKMSDGEKGISLVSPQNLASVHPTGTECALSSRSSAGLNQPVSGRCFQGSGEPNPAPNCGVLINLGFPVAVSAPVYR